MLDSVVGGNDKSSLLTGDLKDSSEQDTNPDYFNITITDLIPDTDYAIQFAWVYEDKTLSPYSANYDLHTIPITIPEVSNIVTEWSETQVSTNKEVSLKITFDRPEETINGVVTNLADSFIITLTYNSISKPITFNVNPNSTQQEYVLSESTAKKLFGVVPNQYSGLIQVVNADGKSDGVSFVTTSKLDGITEQPIPDSSWALTKVLDGYIVSWAAFTDPAAKAAYDYTEIWQSTAELGTYELVAFGLSPQPIVYYADLSTKYVKIRHRTKRGTYSLYSNVKQIKAADPSGYDANGPSNDGALTLGTPEVDDNGLFDFNYKFQISWVAETDATTLGYRIRWRIKDSGDPYTYTLAPGKDTTSTYLYGVVANTTYEVGKNTLDEYGNTTATWKTDYVTTGSFSGEIKETKYLKAGNMKLGYGIGGKGGAADSDVGKNKGLYLGSSNYWYVTGNQVTDSGAYIKVGSSTSNLIFDGTDLYVTGIVNANGGDFSGSINVGSPTISGQLRVVQAWDTDGSTPLKGIEIGKFDSVVKTDVVTGGVSHGIYAYDKTDSAKYVLINAKDGSIRATDAYLTGSLKTGTSTSYIHVGETAGSIKFKVSGFQYEGQITYESLYGSLLGSLTIAPPSTTNSAGGTPYIDLVQYSTGGGMVSIFSPTTIDIDAESIVMGNSGSTVNIQYLGWTNDSGTTSNPTIRLIGTTTAGNLAKTFGVITSGAYGTTTPPTNLGSDGDFLFST